MNERSVTHGTYVIERTYKVALDRVLHALGDPTHRAIVEQLSYGPVSVSQFAEPPDITLAAVVQHVKSLEKSDLVLAEKVGRVRTCRMEAFGLDVAQDWLLERRSLWERRLDRLAQLLAEPNDG